MLGGSLLNAGAGLFGSSQAASAQKKAAAAAAQTQLMMYNDLVKRMEPYTKAGEAGLNQLMGRLGFLTSPITMDQASLEQTPGYQFTRDQGLKSVQNSAAARGLGSSGASLKGAGDYATQLANKTYQDQFNLENINRTNEYNRLFGLGTMGANANAGVGTAGVQTGQGMGQNLTNMGNASAAGTLGMTNAIGGLGSSLSQMGLINNLLTGQNKPGLFNNTFSFLGV